MNKIILSFTLITLLLIFGCGKKQDTTSQKQEQSTEQNNQKSLEQQKKEDSLKAITDQQEKEKKVKEALEEEKILNDTSGQWAISAEASSTYADHAGKDTWSAEQMTGKPDVETYGDNGNAWTSKEADKGLEWVQLTFSKAVNAYEVRIRQTFNPGAIIKVELIDEKGKNHTIWEGVDKTKYEQDKIQYFISKFDKTDYKTKSVKITLATNSVPGWNEIDAVQLIGN
jgi:hypothetical protein